MNHKLIHIARISALIACLLSCNKENDTTYEVTGTEPFDVVYLNQNGDTSREYAVSSGWAYAWVSSEKNEPLFVRAESYSAKTNATVSVKIKRNGRTIETANRSGSYATASARR